MSFPRVITSSVIRSAYKGESHGGVYICDLETGYVEQVIDWNDDTIDWEGRGGDRGLRGIAFHDDKVYLAASDEIFVYTKKFELVESYRNKYLKHCHEIFISGNTLFLTSTGFDSVLEFDLLQSRSFTRGYCIRYGKIGRYLRRLHLRHVPTLRIFDPNSNNGPPPGDTTHINSVYYSEGCLYVSGARLGSLLCLKGSKLLSYARIPYLTHNAQPFREGVLLNDTAADRVTYLNRSGRVLESFSIKHYEEEELLRADLPKDTARQAFSRGLCLVRDGLIIGGSSPATISVYQLGGPPTSVKTINITMDVRNSIHGLEIWPY
jgi:hypothetical protein